MKHLTLKRFPDIAVSLVWMLLFAVPFALICLLIKIESPGPVFFCQERIGKDGRPFKIWKFRTMVDGAVNLGLGYTTGPEDQRITRVGHVLRLLSLDEVPQLINVLLGDMSLVGPRPTLGYQVEQYDAEQRRRLDVKPGVTSLAAVNGRNALSWEERIEMDVWYVRHWSLWLDLKILAKTPWVALVTRKGIYGTNGINDDFSNSVHTENDERQQPANGKYDVSDARGNISGLANTGGRERVMHNNGFANGNGTIGDLHGPAHSNGGSSGEPATSVVIYGAGGHGKVVADVLERANGYRILGFLDDLNELTGKRVLGYEILDTALKFFGNGYPENCHLILAIGPNEIRQRLADHAVPEGISFATAIHPSAQIARDVIIGPGTVIMANAVVNSGAYIGAHVIINTGATIDHDCVIDDYVHIAPGTHLAGGVHVGRGTLVGIGAIVVPGVRIGQWTLIGAGATVLHSVPEHVTAVGSPAVLIDKHAQVESEL